MKIDEREVGEQTVRRMYIEVDVKQLERGMWGPLHWRKHAGMRLLWLAARVLRMGLRMDGP